MSNDSIGTAQKKIVNDFSITFSTINGSGSATSNMAILRALFRMGIPASGKNIFPSNIQGMPTWFTIRVSEKGYFARKDVSDIVISMNPTTLQKDIMSLPSGGVLFYTDDLKLPVERDDIYVYPMAVKKIIKDSDTPANLRTYISNMVYVGVLAQMMGISLEKVREAIVFAFNDKEVPVNSNFGIISKAAEWAKDNLVKKDPYYIEPSNKTDDWVLAEGNVAGGLGAIYGGMQLTAWYPITPASSMVESMIEHAPKLRTDPETGKNTFAIVQAEDELSAIGMAIGGGWAGLRSMTSTSGPGMSLMGEYMGLAFFAEVPVVVWNVQRVGPSTGLPTRTAQGDITQAAFLSHGDRRYITLIPCSVNECFEFGWKAFDIAERFQTPVIVLSDLDLGMNFWMTPKFNYPDKPMDRGKVIWEEDLQRILDERAGDWGRYLDIDGDGVPYRTVPGNMNAKSGYFTRGTGHDEYARYAEDAAVWERVFNRIMKKFETAKSYIPAPVLEKDFGSRKGIIAYGSTMPAVLEAADMLSEAGNAYDVLRLRALPFTDDVKKFIEDHDEVAIVEMNHDGQMRQLLLMEYPELATRLKKAAVLNGLPLSAQNVLDLIGGQE